MSYDKMNHGMTEYTNNEEFRNVDRQKVQEGDNFEFSQSSQRGSIKHNGGTMKQEHAPRVDTIRRRLEMEAIQKQAERAALHRVEPGRQELTNFYSIPANKYQTMPVKKKTKPEREYNRPERGGFRATLRRFKDALFGRKKRPNVQPQAVVSQQPPQQTQQRNLPQWKSLPRNTKLQQKEPVATAETISGNQVRTAAPTEDPMIPLRKGFPNLGNSCYWNAVLQCVGAMEPFASYYLDGQHRPFVESLTDKTEGSQYDLNIVFGKLIDAMWQNTDGANHIARIRNILMSRYNSVFSQTAQEDAQEFLMTLTQYLYESPHTTTDSSVFARVCGGLVGESLLCPNCGFEGRERSMYHDVLPLSFPELHQTFLNYSVVYPVGKHGRVIRHATHVDSESGIRGVARLISHETGIPHSKLLLFQTNSSSFAQSLVTTYDISRPRNTTDGDSFHATELENLPLGLDGLENVNCIFVHTIISHAGRERMTEPFLCKMSISSSYVDIVENIFSSSGAVVNAPPRERFHELFHMFRITMHDDNLPEGTVLSSNPGNPPLIEANVQRNMDEHTRILPWLPRFVRLVVEWRNPPHNVFAPEKDMIVSHNSYDSSSTFYHPTLHTIFKHYFLPAFTDGWRCENCLEKGGIQRAYYKKPPRILIAMLKRFQRQEHGVINKIDTPINIVLEKFDISAYCEKPGRKNTPEERVGLIYDVIGLVCHTGAIARGHYYAYTRNPLNNVWRRYDDNVVTVVKDSEIDTADAYMVFLQNRQDRLVRKEALPKNRRFLSSIRNQKWTKSDRQSNGDREPLNMLPNGPLINQTADVKSEPNRSVGFRRDDASRRPTTSMSAPKHERQPANYDQNRTLTRDRTTLSRAMPEFRNTIDGLLSRKLGEKERKETEI